MILAIAFLQLRLLIGSLSLQLTIDIILEKYGLDSYSMFLKNVFVYINLTLQVLCRELRKIDK